MAGYSISDGTQFEGSPFPSLLIPELFTCVRLVVLHIFLNKLTRARVCLTFIFLLLQCNNQGGSCDVGCQEGRQEAKKAKVAKKAAKRPRKPRLPRRPPRGQENHKAGQDS
jgi:hypothetical protein